MTHARDLGTRTAAAVLALLAAACAGDGSSLVVSSGGIQTGEYWTDQVALHDGRTIDVRRSVSYERNPAYRYDGGIPGRGLSTRHQLAFTNPDTGQRVAWEPPPDFNPVVVDFHGGRAYGVIEQATIYGNLKQFGCPEIPYVFMRHDGGSWRQMRAADFPMELLRGDLSPSHETFMKDGAVQSSEAIAGAYRMREREGASGAAIPADFASWQSRYKKRWRVHHTMDGCLESIPSNKDPTHPQEAGQRGQAVDLEIMDVHDHEPLRVFHGTVDGPNAEWTAMSWGSELQSRCRSLLTVLGEDADDPRLRYWALFKADPTARNKVHPELLLSCTEDFLWFTGRAQDSSHRKLLKYTKQGALVYSIEFGMPQAIPGFNGAILRPTVRSEGGYLYFDWADIAASGYDTKLRRSTKVRLKEPAA